MIYSCEEHVDIAIDTIVDDYETFPQLTKLKDVDNSPKTCEFCQQQAIYLVANK